MGRVYAGILGPLAFAVVLLRSLRQGAGVESTLLTAIVCLIVFALIGWIAGSLAQWIVEQSVRSQMAAQDATPGTGTATSA